MQFSVALGKLQLAYYLDVYAIPQGGAREAAAYQLPQEKLLYKSNGSCKQLFFKYSN